MQGVVENSSLHNREEMLQAMKQMSQPNPQQQQMAQQAAMLEMQKKQAETNKLNAEAQKAQVQAQLEPKVVEAKVIAALTNNLDENDEDKSFRQRVEIANLALREKDIDSNENIAKMQTMANLASKQQSVQ
jgi:hypothetical protein